MKSTTKHTLAIIVGLAALITSCKKEGCTDKDATNYDVNADVNNSTCQYEGSYVVWTKPSCANMNVYLDGALQGNVGVTFTSAPDCEATGALTIKKSLGASKTKTFKLHATHPANSCGLGEPDLVWDETLTFQANKCSSLELQ